MSSEPKNVTVLLNDWSSGDEAAGQPLITVVYGEFRRLAASCLQSERPDHTLQAKALVQELHLTATAAR